MDITPGLTLRTGQTATLSGVVRNVVGEALPGTTVAWTASAQRATVKCVDRLVTAVTETQPRSPERTFLPASRALERLRSPSAGIGRNDHPPHPQRWRRVTSTITVRAKTASGQTSPSAAMQWS